MIPLLIIHLRKADIGIYGLGVMGAGLALNLVRQGFRVALFNRTVPGKGEQVVQSFLGKEEADKDIAAAQSEKQFIDSLRSGSLPANIMQAQRDYFGAHTYTYERTDYPKKAFFSHLLETAI